MPKYIASYSTDTGLFLEICERSLTSSRDDPTAPPATCFVRAEMLPSGCLIRPCEGGGSIVHIVDHIDLDVRNYLIIFWAFVVLLLLSNLTCKLLQALNVPEILRPLYESSKILAQKMTMPVRTFCSILLCICACSSCSYFATECFLYISFRPCAILGKLPRKPMERSILVVVVKTNLLFLGY